MRQSQELLAESITPGVYSEGSIDEWLTMLANSDRRAMVRFLTSSEQRDGASVGAIAFAAGVSRFSASRHLQMLRQAGLVESHRVGNRVIVRVVAEPFRLIDDWLWQVVGTLDDRA